MAAAGKSTGANGGRRDAAKAERRRRIVEAARALIRETGEAGFSMRAVAARARVSHATPYNLFGSKRALVLALFEDVRDFERRFAGSAALPAVDRLFAALRLTCEIHEMDPDFYRTVWACLLDTGSSARFRADLIPPQSGEFWRDLLREAVRAGAIREDVGLDLLQRELGKCFSANMLDWVLGNCEAPDLYRRTALGYALLLCGAATAQGAPGLRERIADVTQG